MLYAILSATFWFIYIRRYNVEKERVRERCLIMYKVREQNTYIRARDRPIKIHILGMIVRCVLERILYSMQRIV